MRTDAGCAKVFMHGGVRLVAKSMVRVIITETNMAYSIGHLVSADSYIVSAVYFLEFFDGGKGSSQFCVR